MRFLALLIALILAFMPTAQANPLDWLGEGNASGSNEPETGPEPGPETASEDSGEAGENGTTDPPATEPEESEDSAGGPIDCIEVGIRYQTVTVDDPRLLAEGPPLAQFDVPFADAELNPDECDILDL